MLTQQLVCPKQAFGKEGSWKLVARENVPLAEKTQVRNRAIESQNTICLKKQETAEEMISVK